MCSFSDKDFGILAECVDNNEEANLCPLGSAAVNNYISEEKKLSARVSSQHVQGIEDHIDVLQLDDRDTQFLNRDMIATPQPLSLPGTTALSDTQDNFDPAIANHSSTTKFDPTLVRTRDLGSIMVTPTSHHSPVDDPPRFSSEGQARTGSHHGKGGRRKGSGFHVRRNYGTYATSVICKRLLELMTMNGDHAFQALINELLSTRTIEGCLFDAFEKFKTVFVSFLMKNVGPYPYTIQELPFCILGVSARFSKSDSNENEKSDCSMSRHIANTWIDCNGGLRCTCLGSTQYFILTRNGEFDVPSCEHTQAFLNIFDSIGENVFGKPCLSPAIIFKAASTAVPDLAHPLKDCFPFFRYVHKQQSIVYMYQDAEIESERCWVPIRCVKRKGMKFLCAFCDSISTNSCHHVKSFTALRLDLSSSHSRAVQADAEELDDQSRDLSETIIGQRPGPISYLPVSPVNCKMALEMELTLCQYVREKKTYVLSAPDRCIYCGAEPHVGSEKTNRSGLIMCSIGACRMEVKTLHCGSCNKRYSAEGRNEGLFLESICTGATHVLLRNELIGFALGNGTLNSRLNQLHSTFVALEDSNVLSNVVPCLSTKSMFRMCTAFAKLAIIDPPKELFWCSTCQKNDGKSISVPKLLCIDGIWAGYLRKSKRAFENIVFEPRESNGDVRPRIVTRAAFRPRASLVRLERAVSFLLLAINGEKIEVSTTSLNAAIAAVRLVSSSVLPGDFYPASVCGRTANDLEFDQGPSILQKIQDLTSSIFDDRTLLYRLINAILTFFQGIAKRRKSKKDSKQSTDLEILLCDSGSSQLDKKGSAKRERKPWMPIRVAPYCHMLFN